MLTSHDLERALSRAGLAAPVRADEVTGSTNATALAWAEEGAPEWTLVAAGHQTAGRGRLGRSWYDRPGEALMCSFVLRPALAPARAGLLTLLAGAAMAEAARALGPEVGCRWPNDLMLADAKVGGILAEAAVEAGRIRHLVIGVGVNLGDAAPDVPGAAALTGVDAAELLGGFLDAFRSRYDPEAPGFAEGVVALARTTNSTLGRRVEVDRADGVRVSGRAVDLDDDGGLVVETRDGRVTVAFGEVTHVGR